MVLLGRRDIAEESVCCYWGRSTLDGECSRAGALELKLKERLQGGERLMLRLSSVRPLRGPEFRVSPGRFVGSKVE